jgi:thiol-disulfide isomerase/thioredoxin
MPFRSSLRRGLALAAALGLAGCNDTVSPPTVSVTPTPSEVLNPQGPDAHKEAGAAKAETAVKSIVAAKSLEAVAPPAADDVALVPLSYDKFRSDVLTNPKAKLTLVDAWATWCGPCKENFPHLVEMHRKYADKGLAVVSLSLDTPSDAKAVDEAKAFLREKGAHFTNVLLDAKESEGFDRLDINGIPAVFLFDPTGKEIRRFTMDNPDRQFTYDQVEQVVQLLLDGKPLPADAGGEVYKPRSQESTKAASEK